MKRKGEIVPNMNTSFKIEQVGICGGYLEKALSNKKRINYKIKATYFTNKKIWFDQNYCHDHY